MKNKYVIAALFASLTIALDQTTKAMVVAKMPLHKPFEIIEGFLNLVYVRNKGAAFGIFSSLSDGFREPMFAVVSVIALGLVIYYLYSARKDQWLLALSLGFILGGASGNIIDRVRVGYVVDFIDAHIYSHHWPTFNVADSAITVGIIIMAVEVIFFEPMASQEPAED